MKFSRSCKLMTTQPLVKHNFAKFRIVLAFCCKFEKIDNEKLICAFRAKITKKQDKNNDQTISVSVFMCNLFLFFHTLPSLFYFEIS